MTTYNVSVPDNKKAFFIEFLELIGAQYQKEDDIDFLLSDQQKHLSLDDCMDADDFLKEMQKKYEL